MPARWRLLWWVDRRRWRVLPGVTVGLVAGGLVWPWGALHGRARWVWDFVWAQADLAGPRVVGRPFPAGWPVERMVAAPCVLLACVAVWWLVSGLRCGWLGRVGASERRREVCRLLEAKWLAAQVRLAQERPRRGGKGRARRG